MVKVVINADDFGMSESVSEAIALGFQKKILSTTTLMVNMPYAMDAVKLAKEKGFIDRVGLHLNLTAGTPLTSPIRSLGRFCDGRGVFHAGFHLSTKTRLFLSKKESMALEEEIEAQIKRYLTFGLSLKHLDSHHHVHTDLSVWKEAEPLLQKYGFRTARISRNMFSEGKCSRLNGIYKNYFNKRVKKAGLVTTDYFGSFDDFKAEFDSLKDGAVAEIMLHPMFSEDGNHMDTNTPMDSIRQYIDKRDILIQENLTI